jgi:vacuolar-type H+-ATPase catalytic subunit A/Vma1
MSTTDTENTAEKVSQILAENKFSTTETVEIIANVLIKEGFATFPSDALPDSITPLNMAVTILDLKKEFGETLGGAMIQQGLVMLMWLENIDK